MQSEPMVRKNTSRMCPAELMLASKIEILVFKHPSICKELLCPKRNVCPLVKLLSMGCTYYESAGVCQ